MRLTFLLLLLFVPLFSWGQTTVSKAYSKLLLVPEIELYGMKWEDLGIKKSSNFTNPVSASWVKWMSNMLPSNVGEVAVCTEACYYEFQNWLQLKREEGMQIPSEYQNVLWLRVNFILRQKFFNQDQNELRLEWEGATVVIDTRTKEVIFTANMLPENRAWRGVAPEALKSSLATAIYSSALDALTKAGRKIAATEANVRPGRLIIQGHRQMEDIFSLMELLKKEGSSLKLSVKLETFSRTEAQLLCFYQGEEKSFTDLLSQLKQLKSTQSYKLVIEPSGVHPVLKLIAP